MEHAADRARDLLEMRNGGPFMNLHRRHLNESQRVLAGVRIDTGPVSHDTPWQEVRPDRKILILGAWRQFFHVDVKYDCRELLRIVEDMQANEAWTALGFADLDDLLRRGIEIAPELVGWAMRGLRVLDPETPQPLEKAAFVGRELMAHDEAGRRGGRGRKAPCRDKGLSYNTADYWKARLRRDDPELLARVERGELTANAAAVAKGWRKPPDPLRELQRWWERATDMDRAQFEAGIVGQSTRVERICRDWREATEDERLVFVAEHADALRLMLDRGPQEVPPAPREAPPAPVEAPIRPGPSCASAPPEGLPQAAPHQTPDEEGETNAV
jgi:hypothetical protein